MSTTTTTIEAVSIFDRFIAGASDFLIWSGHIILSTGEGMEVDQLAGLAQETLTDALRAEMVKNETMRSKCRDFLREIPVPALTDVIAKPFDAGMDFASFTVGGHGFEDWEGEHEGQTIAEILDSHAHGYSFEGLSFYAIDAQGVESSEWKDFNRTVDRITFEIY